MARTVSGCVGSGDSGRLIGPVEDEAEREEFARGVGTWDAVEMDGGVGSKFEEPLAAGAARGTAFGAEGRIGVEAGDGDSGEPSGSGGDRGGKRVPFSAEAEAVARVLDVAAGELAAVITNHHCAHPEFRVGRVGGERGRPCGGEESLPIGNGSGVGRAVAHLAGAFFHVSILLTKAEGPPLR